MIVIYIALGIVLAVLILAFLPEVLVLCLCALAVVIAIAVVCVAGYFVVMEPVVSASLAGLGAAIWCIQYWSMKRDEKKKALEKQQGEVLEMQQREESQKRQFEALQELEKKACEALEVLDKNRHEALKIRLSARKAEREKEQEEWERRYQQYE